MSLARQRNQRTFPEAGREDVAQNAEVPALMGRARVEALECLDRVVLPVTRIDRFPSASAGLTVWLSCESAGMVAVREELLRLLTFEERHRRLLSRLALVLTTSVALDACGSLAAQEPADAGRSSGRRRARAVGGGGRRRLGGSNSVLLSEQRLALNVPRGLVDSRAIGAARELRAGRRLSPAIAVFARAAAPAGPPAAPRGEMRSRPSQGREGTARGDPRPGPGSQPGRRDAPLATGGGEARVPGASHRRGTSRRSSRRAHRRRLAPRRSRPLAAETRAAQEEPQVYQVGQSLAAIGLNGAPRPAQPPITVWRVIQHSLSPVRGLASALSRTRTRCCGGGRGAVGRSQEFRWRGVSSD